METRTNSLIQNSNNNTSRTFIVELLFAIYCCVPSINDILYCFIGRSVMTFLYLLVIASLVVVAFLKIQKLKEKSFLDSVFFLILIYIILLYVISTVLSYSSIEPVYFVSWFIFPFFAFYVLNKVERISLKRMVFLISIIPCLGIFVRKELFVLSANSTISMGTSYNFLTPVLACIACLLFYFYKLSLSKKILYCPVLIINALYFIELLKYGSRGPILCISALLIVFLVFRYNSSKRKVILLPINAVIIIVFILIVALNFKSLLQNLSNHFDFNILNKMLVLYENNNILNNRSNEYTAALNSLPNSLFFGHGVSSFSHFTGYVYPHNIFLQLLFDGGILLAAVVLVPLILTISKLFISCSKDEYVFFIYFFSVAFVHSLVSGNIWANEKLWILFAFSLLCSKGDLMKKQFLSTETN